MIKVKIKRPIYIRKGAGRSHETFAAIYPSGKDVFMDGVEKGENWKGINEWYYKINNKGEKQWYWAGGVSIKSFNDKVNEFLLDPYNTAFIDKNDPHNQHKWKVSWGHIDLGIWKIWRDYNAYGEGVKIAIIDTGAWFSDNDLNGQIDIINSRNFMTNDFNLNDNDPDLHGTKTAGIISASGRHAKSVMGIAPASKLVIFKIMNNIDGGGTVIGSNLIRAIRKAREVKVDMISISIELMNNPPELQNEIDLCFESNILIFAAVGNSNGPSIRFPAACKHVIAVGAYTIQNDQPRVFSEFSSQGDHLRILAPGDKIITTGKDKHKSSHSATSAATPFVVGIFSLFKSFLKSQGKVISNKEIDLLIERSCIRIDGSKSRNAMEGFGILQPDILFSLAKK